MAVSLDIEREPRGYTAPPSSTSRARPGCQPQILVYGCSGANVGDDAILHAVCKRIRRQFADASIVAASPYPDRVEESEVERLVHTFNQVGNFYFGRSWARRQVPAFFETWRAVRKADLVLIGGGGLLNDMDEPSWMLQWTAPAVIGRMLGKPVMGIGLGAGPFNTRRGKWLARTVGRCCRVVTVRDAYSRAALIEAGLPVQKVVLTADPAFDLAAEDADCGKVSTAGPIGVVPRFDGFHPERVRAFLPRLLAELERGGKSWVVAAASRRDYEHAAEVVAKHGDLLRQPARVINASTLPAWQAFARSMSTLVSMRMHGCILSAACGTPPLPVHTYDPKLKSIAELFGTPCVDLASDDVSAAVEQTIHGLSQIQSGEFRLRMRHVIQQMRGRLEVHDQWMATVLQERVAPFTAPQTAI